MKIMERIAKSNGCYSSGKRIAVKGLMLHSVGCAQASAEVFVRQWDSPTAKVCVHAIIDANNGNVYQILPWNYRAWHCGGKANSTHIGVEMCEPDCIRYTSGANFACTDLQKAKTMVEKTLKSAAELFAFLCKQYGLDPLAEGVIISHKEGHDKGVASGHADPDHLFRQLGMDYSMNRFREEVKQIMEAGGLSEEKQCEKQNENYGKTVKPGDVVALAPNSFYYNGTPIPLWVKTDNWVVNSVNGDRVVLGKNVKGDHDIRSAVGAKYLRVVSSSIMPPPPGGVPTMPPPPGGVPTMPPPPESAKEFEISDRGVALIARYESCRLDAYICPAGKWTIGYGHTEGVCRGQKLASEAEAWALLKKDLVKYAGYVNECIKGGKVSFPVTQCQFDALTSFCYNCGKGNLVKLVTDRSAEQVAEHILAYNKGGGKKLEGLVRRRNDERDMFLGKDI